ncbi:MAG: beta-ketoacyl synthase N-terminal-like domain-containing protein [Luteolibacter sp.]|uniref:beta-ketoacyl synthase N-terminal-like domain-containing protein n=1 Tax=Luteolibacter sp. TaxID=1962973 RepID=UPI00326489CC
MSIAITGTGAVSPAGWGVAALLDAVSSSKPISPSVLERQSGETTVRTPVLRVPEAGATTPKFARLRRTSPISKFAAAAMAEALGEVRLAEIAAGTLRVGVIFTVTNGCVNYSNRFFGEALADPAMASPILFPETVFNAPSSHLSAMIGSESPNDTLIGDSTGFFSGIDLAVEWIERGDVDGCVVISAEEIDWLSAEGLCLYSRGYMPSEGAAAIYLESAEAPVKLLRLPDPVSLSANSRLQAAQKIRSQLAASDDGNMLLIDGRTGVKRHDLPESIAWADWSGPRWSPRAVLGEGMGVSSALQVVAAVEALKAGLCQMAVVSAVGANQQAAGLVLGKESKL